MLLIPCRTFSSLELYGDFSFETDLLLILLRVFHILWFIFGPHFIVPDPGKIPPKIIFFFLAKTNLLVYVGKVKEY